MKTSLQSLKIVLAVFFGFLGANAFGQTVISTNVPGDYYLSIPCDVTSITVELWGAGGGGQKASGNPSAGGGGAGGGYIKTTYAVTAGKVYDLHVGSGGSGNSGVNGEASWFNTNTSLLAVGGRGAGGAVTGGNSWGTGANAFLTGNIGGTTVSTYGGNGANASSTYSGGSGSSAGNTIGNNASGITGGTAPVNGYTGVNGKSNSTAGNTGNTGSGGSGGRNTNGTVRNGGAGGPGQIKITYTSLLTVYCAQTFSTVEPITNVTYAGINNTTSNTINGTPDLEYFCSYANVKQGGTDAISLKGNTDGASTNNFRVYIDWDQNGVFGNVSNEVYDIGTISNSTGVDAKVATGNIVVPVTATLGATRMRVIKNYNAYTGPCTAATYGQAEEYNVNVTAAVACVAPTAQPTSLILTPAATSVSGSFTASATANGYLVVRTITATAPTGPTNGTVYTAGATALGGTIVKASNTATFTDSPLSSSTQYWYWVFAYNDGCTGQPVYRTASPLNGNTTTLAAPMKLPDTGNNSYTVCSGTLYDNGGQFGNYSDNIDTYTVLNPLIPGNLIQVSGTGDVEPNYDILYIYDGVGIGGTLLWSGYGTGTFPTQTSTTGSLTIRLKSDSSNNQTGFVMNIACVPPTYCEPTSWTPDGLYINSVAFIGTLSDPPVNTSTFNNAAPKGFQNFTTLPIKAIQAQGEGINIIASTSLSGTQYVRGTWKAWVDWNKNGTFEPATEEVYNIQGYAGSDATFGFVIPPSTPPGDYRIRIRVNNGYDTFYGDETFGFDFSPCDNFERFPAYDDWIKDYGETEDYLFTVVAKCNTLITAKIDGKNCGTGTVDLKATATAGVTEFRWYDALTGGTLMGTSVPSGTSTTFTTASLTATTNYYVTAWNGTCETQVRTLVVAKINPTPVVAFTQSVPDVCGDGAILQLTAGGDKEVTHLINENFEAGTLGVFSNLNDDTNSATVKANTSWKNQTSTLIPNANVWFPAISSGFGANKFALAYSDSIDPDYPTTTVENSIALTTSVNTNTYLNLTLKLKLFYSRYFPDGYIDPTDDEYVNIELSTDGGSTYPTVIQSFTSDVGIGSRFEDLSYDLSAYKNQPNLKIRIRHRSYAGDGWLPDGVAIDNVELYGEKPLSSSFNYDTTIVNAYTNVLCTAPYAYTSGTPATTIWLKPTAAQLESNTTFTIPVFATLSNGCSATGSVVITNNSKIWNSFSTDWNSTNWKPNTAAPTSSQCVVVKTPVTLGIGVDGLAKNITIQPGGSLTIKKDRTLTVTDFIKNETAVIGNEDNLVLESDANLIQINSTAPNSGKMTAKRAVTGLVNNPIGKKVDYVYWSSPVAGQITKGTAEGAFSPGTNPARFYYYLESNDRFYETGDPFFRLGRGYAVQAEANIGTSPYTAPYDKTYQFKGTPNNGEIDFGLAFTNSAHGFNLVGNPYPSNIDFDQLYYGNSSLISNTAYFWTNNVYEQYQLGQGYGGNNYAIYNGTGGNSSTAAGGAGNNVVPDGVVKVGQGFIVQAKKAGNLNFKNSYPVDEKGSHQLRVSDSGDFFQKGATQKNRFWLTLLAPSTLVNSQLIGYVAGATNDYEQDFDAEAFDNYSDLFYSIIPSKKLLIQGKSEVFTNEDKVVLGANFFANGSYTVALDKAEGIFNGSQTIYLKDKQEGIITNLSQGSYTFTAAKGDNTGRFEIIYKPEAILATGDVTKDQLVVYKAGNDFVVKSSTKKITALEVYDAAGRLIYTTQPMNTEAVIPAEKLINNVYVVKIDRNGEISTKKIIK